MKLVWTGSDVLYQLQYPPFIRFRFRVKIFFERIITRLIQPFLECNVAVSDNLERELRELGYKNIKVHPDPCSLLCGQCDLTLHKGKHKKIKHEGYNVLYYIPKGKKNQKFIEWLYGWDLMLGYKTLNPTHNIIEVNGDSDMSKIYPIIDLYYRPTRHDGMPRMILECKIQEIEVIHDLQTL